MYRVSSNDMSQNIWRFSYGVHYIGHNFNFDAISTIKINLIFEKCYHRKAQTGPNDQYNFKDSVELCYIEQNEHNEMVVMFDCALSLIFLCISWLDNFNFYTH